MICFVPEEAAVVARALQGRTGQYVMTSTIDVYRKPAVRLPYLEDSPHGGIGQYALAKVACERILWDAHDREGLPLTVIRPAATYGEGGRLVQPLGFRPTLIDRMRKGKPIIVHGDGSSLWVSCHRDDVASAFVGAVSRPPEVTIGTAYHATGEEWVTWDQHLGAGRSGCRRTAAGSLPHPERCAPRASHPRRVGWPGRTSGSTTSSTTRPPTATSDFRRPDPAARWPATARRRRSTRSGGVDDSDLDPLDDRIIGTWRALVTQAELTLAPLDPSAPPVAGKV